MVYYIRMLCSLSEQTVKLGLTSHLKDLSVGTKGWVIHLKLNKINIVNPHYFVLRLFAFVLPHPGTPSSLFFLAKFAIF